MFGSAMLLLSSQLTINAVIVHLRYWAMSWIAITGTQPVRSRLPCSNISRPLKPRPRSELVDQLLRGVVQAQSDSVLVEPSLLLSLTATLYDV